MNQSADSWLSSARNQQLHDNYPVHLIDQVQPHGVLFAIALPDFVIERVSCNSEAHLGIAFKDLLGQPLSAFLDAENCAQIEDAAGRIAAAISETGDDNTTFRPLYLRVSAQFKYLRPDLRQSSRPDSRQNSRQWFDGFLHSAQGKLILELEPIVLGALSQINADAHLEYAQNEISQVISRLRQIKDADAFLQAVTAELQQLTEYDRVMVYQFDEKSAGSVVAETKQIEQTSYLGLLYPATDIPALVRSFYQSGMVRVVPDLSIEPVAIARVERIRAEDPTPEGIFSEDTVIEDILVEQEMSQRLLAPLDLSQATLRGVDPCCVEYHHNMGVAAFMVIALIKDNHLWGLIAFHHRTPKNLPYSLRSTCEILSQFVASELSHKVNEDEIDYLNQLKAIQSDFISSISEAENFKEALIHPEPRLLDLVSATGVAVCLERDITLIGQTPGLEHVKRLIEWSLTENDQDVFFTDCLSSIFPDAASYQPIASGTLILTISKLRKYLILWFRPEVIQTVNWAGDPISSMQKTDEGEILLCPRNSFELWQETVQGTALPWKSAEIESAFDLKYTIVGIVLNKADERAQVNLELAISNQELDSFAYAASHDLKEPLRGITNFANILLRRHSDDLDETGVKRLKTLVRLAQRMDTLIDALLRFSRLGQAELRCEPTDIDLLVHRAIDDLMVGREGTLLLPAIEIPRALPVVTCDPILIREVFINLIGNALKYCDKPKSVIEIGYLTPLEQLEHGWELNFEGAFEGSEALPVFYVQDNGIGIPERHYQNIFRLFKRLHDRESYGGGNGVGLTITQKIIERHGGHIWVESVLGETTKFYFGIE